MELFLRITKNKAPFIGVAFANDLGSQGQKLNRDLVDLHSSKQFEIVLEQYNNTLNLRLICQELVTVRFYNNLYFDADKLKSWLYLSRAAKQLKFGHVGYTYDKKPEILLTSPNRKIFVLKIESCKLIEGQEEYEPLLYGR